MSTPTLSGTKKAPPRAHKCTKQKLRAPIIYENIRYGIAHEVFSHVGRPGPRIKSSLRRHDGAGLFSVLCTEKSNP